MPLTKIPKPVLIPAAIIFALTVSLILVRSESPEYMDTEPFFFGAQDRIAEIFDPDTVTPLIQQEVPKLEGRYAVYIKDLKKQRVYSYNSEEIFPAASIYKLAVMYKTYDALQKGQLADDQTVSADKSYLDRKLEGVEEPEQSESGESIGMSVHEALRLMITISDNYSALLLAEKLGWANIERFMDTQNFPSFNFTGEDDPTVNAKDAGELLEKIYGNLAVSQKASEEMKRLLFAQTANDRIPKYLPKSVKVGHKTGELEGIRNDAGIVMGKKSDYIFVFLSETSKPEDASENIALLSKKIYDELER